MRLTVQIWMLLALLLVERNIVKADSPDDMIDIDGSGDGEPANVEGPTPDDEDNTETPAEIGSGTDKPMVRVLDSVKPSFDNTIKLLKIGKERATFQPAHNDPNSVESQLVFGQVCAAIENTLQQNQLTSTPESCEGVSITEGSLVVKTKLTFPENTEVTSTDVQGAIQESVDSGTLADGTTMMKVDPASVMVEPSNTETVPEPTGVVDPPAPSTKKPKEPKPVDQETHSTARPNQGNQDNDIFFTTVTMKPDMDTNTTMSNSLDGMEDADHNNKLGVKNDKEKEQNFFEMILGNPVLLAAVVGAVVLTLITIILIVMFMIYRVKKKDEGSYSLDEPHKVKDPTTYWKDTKEFYA